MEGVINDDEKTTLFKNENSSFQDKSILSKCLSVWMIISTIAFTAAIIIALLIVIIFRTQLHGVDIKEFFSQTNVACGYSCTKICFKSSEKDCFNECYSGCNGKSGDEPKYPGAFSPYIKRNAIHHVGITVADKNRTVDFFVKMLGGVRIPDPGNPGMWGVTIQQFITQKELLDMKTQNKTMEELQIAYLSDNGTDRCIGTWVNFGSLSIELVDYFPREGKEKESKLPFSHRSTSPSIKNNMHLAFRIRDNVDLNEFINIFERKSKEEGFEEVKCNRMVPVKDEEERERIGIEHPEYNSLIAGGRWQGMGFAYCKGPESIQLEFIIDRAGESGPELFDTALLKYISSR